MIINYSEKDGKKGCFINEGKNSVRVSKNGKSFCFLVTENSLITIAKDNKTSNITGKEFLDLLFK